MSCTGTCGEGLTGFYNEYTEGDYRVIESNGIPPYEYFLGRERIGPAEACEHPIQIKLPLNPVHHDNPVPTGLGIIGWTIGGGFIFNHLSGPG